MRYLNSILAPALTAPPVRRAKVKAHHYQVYNLDRFNSLPAYVGTDKAKADEIAARIGGTVELVPWACGKEEVRA
jgi:hypothetical protein